MDQMTSSEVQALAPLLVAFSAAANAGHITQAAVALDVPQSSLSRRIRALEDTLGVRLFRPSGRGVVLTPQGRDLHERTRGLVGALDEAVQSVLDDADPEGGLVRFGFPLTLGPVSIPAVLADFHAGAPRIRWQLVQGHAEALSASVRDGRLDLAVTIPPPADLPGIELGRQVVDLYVSRDHPLAGRSSVELAELADADFVATPVDYHLRAVCDRWCAEAGFVARVRFEISEFDTLRALVARGLGVALLPPPETPHPELVRIPLRGHYHRTIGLVTGHGALPAPARRLRDHLRAHAGRLGALG